MSGFTRQPVLLALMIAGIFCSPVTYQGGAAAAHPHMFLQLWQDAASGSFRHHAASHGHNHYQHTGTVSPEPLVASERPDGQPTLTAFVVSGWSHAAILAPSHLRTTSIAGREGKFAELDIAPAGRVDIPDPPPPQRRSVW